MNAILALNHTNTTYSSERTLHKINKPKLVDMKTLVLYK